MAVFRKKYVTTTIRKTIETGFYAAATMSVCVLFISFGDLGGCQTALDPDNRDINIHNLQKWTCGKDEEGN